MSSLKLLASVFLGLAIIFGRVGSVYAASPQQDDAPITGTIQSVIVETNSESGVQTVVVTLLVNGEVQMVRLGIEAAASLNLFVLDEMGNPVVGEDGNPVVDEALIGSGVEIDPSTVIPDEPATEEKQHPVGAKISEFFSGLFSVDDDVVMNSHTGGFGFGVITQAMWITHKLGGDASFFQTILDAKESGDYSLVTLPNGNIPQNWGQLKKTVLKGEDTNSLGDVMSDVISGGDTQSGNPGNGKPENPDNGKPENSGNSNGNKPDTPPGQTKDKTKDNNGNNKTK